MFPPAIRTPPTSPLAAPTCGPPISRCPVKDGWWRWIGPGPARRLSGRSADRVRPGRITVNDHVEAMEARRWGIPVEDLATRETVFADDLFRDRTVVISGGGSGIGRASAFLFRRLGARVVICGRDKDKLDAAVDAAERLAGIAIHAEAVN